MPIYRSPTVLTREDFLKVRLATAPRDWGWEDEGPFFQFKADVSSILKPKRGKMDHPTVPAFALGKSSTPVVIVMPNEIRRNS
jgi:hypothetical protein